jgi:hypothetical protein
LVKKDPAFTREGFAARRSWRSSHSLKDKEKLTDSVAADATVIFLHKKLFDRRREYRRLTGTTRFRQQGRSDLQGRQRKVLGFATCRGRTNAGQLSGRAQYQPMIVANGGKVYDAEANRVYIGSPEAVTAGRCSSSRGAPGESRSTCGCRRPRRPHLPAPTPWRCASGAASRCQGGLGSDWDVVQMPKAVGDKRAVGGGSYGIGMASEQQGQGRRLHFVKWFYSNEGGHEAHARERRGWFPPPRRHRGGCGASFPGRQRPDVFAVRSRRLSSLRIAGWRTATMDRAVAKALQEVLLEGDRSVADAFQEAEKTSTLSWQAEVALPWEWGRGPTPGNLEARVAQMSADETRPPARQDQRRRGGQGAPWRLDWDINAERPRSFTVTLYSTL